MLKTLQKVAAGDNKTTTKYYSLFHALKEFYLTRQNPEESVQDYYHCLEVAQDLVTLSKGSVANFIDIDVAHEQTTNATATKGTTLQKFLAMAFIE